MQPTFFRSRPGPQVFARRRSRPRTQAQRHGTSGAQPDSRLPALSRGPDPPSLVAGLAAMRRRGLASFDWFRVHDVSLGLLLIGILFGRLVSGCHRVDDASGTREESLLRYSA